MKSRTVRSRTAARKRGRPADPKTRLLFCIVRSFLLGTVSCALLLCILSLIFEKTTLPLTLVRPAACLAASVGVYLSGWDLARGFARYKLLIGLGCGAFYCLCLVAAALFAGGIASPTTGNLSLAAAILLSGMAGGATAALRQPVSSRRD